MANDISRRDFLKWSGIGAAGMMLPGCQTGLGTAALGTGKESVAKPNVIVILADDLGYCDTELYGCDRIPTPNLRRIADSGVTFSNGYVTNPVCSPSRAGLLTGCYQQRFGFEYNTGPITRDWSQQLGLPVTEKTIADVMKQSGYATGMVGKWHVGSRPQFHPTRRGFDEFFGFRGGGNNYIDPTRPDVRATGRGGAVVKRGEWKRQGHRQIMRGTTPVEENDYLTDAFSREAVDFINRHRDRPFFLYLPYNAPHTPLQATLEYYDRFPHIGEERKRIYAAMVSAMDDGIGSILDTLKDNGVEENTLVFFLSDNGCALYTGACSNDPLRLGKISQFEGGIRVPFCVKWPGHVPAGRTYDYPVSALDILPTALAAAGGTMPTDRHRDGVDLVPYLNGTPGSRPHEALFWRNGPNWAVRKGDWKLFAAGDHYWLYDLAGDIGEKANMAQQRPELVEQILEIHDQWNRQMIDPIWPPKPGGKIPTSVDGVEFSWHL